MRSSDKVLKLEEAILILGKFTGEIVDVTPYPQKCHRKKYSYSEEICEGELSRESGHCKKCYRYCHKTYARYGKSIDSLIPIWNTLNKIDVSNILNSLRHLTPDAPKYKEQLIEMATIETALIIKDICNEN